MDCIEQYSPHRASRQLGFNKWDVFLRGGLQVHQQRRPTLPQPSSFSHITVVRWWVVSLLLKRTSLAVPYRHVWLAVGATVVACRPDAALAAAAAGAHPLVSTTARRAAAQLSFAAYSTAGGDIEDSPVPGRSLLARFRERRALAITDITATEWCEKQMEFMLEHGKPERTEAMRAGSERHVQLEQEVVERVEVTIRSAEELWAVKFMNFIMGTNQLMFEGMTREIPVIGVVEGSWMIGIIDEIRMPIDGISFQPILVDSKTRVRPTIPSEAQKRNGRLKYRVATLLPSSERYVAAVHTNDLVVSGKTNTTQQPGSRSRRRDPGEFRRLAGGGVPESLRPLHEPLWRELGILEGILATTRVRRGGEGALLQLVPFWSPETNTFVFPWGEATVTLEDVAVLGGLPLVRESVREPLSDKLQMDDERALGAVRDLLMNRSKGTGWMKHFRIRHQQRRPEETTAAAAGGRDEEQLLEHGAFLSMWLSHFVLPSPPFGVAVPEEEVIPIAVRLARGQSVALAPAALASIYSDLSALRRHFVWAKRTEAPSVSAPMHILQLWVWERFAELRPSAPAGIPESAGGGDVPVPRAARWHDVAGGALDPGYLHAVLAAPKDGAVLRKVLAPVRARGHGLGRAAPASPCGEQLGFDQDVPGIVTRLNSDSWEKAWETYDIGAGCYAFAVPSDKPGVTDEYAQWWKQYSLSYAATAAAERAAAAGKAHKVTLDGEGKNGRGNGGILASNKGFGPRLKGSAQASKKGSAGNRERSSSRLAPAGNTELGSDEVCTKTLYFLSRSDRSKEAWEKDANSTGADQGFFHPKRAVGTEEMIQKASEIRQAEIAELMKNIAKLAREIREEEAAEALKK
ncbi:hypothetical protein C2845_PM02G08850 [Panicum miliaceum]|uniref:Aminotransferase-like plant mobile domain-containing protein n=1 Tax=Panicum miliaceum TaxID=4540 RepID=A0A3L6S5M8_PANMI|nr:hypothetical protein C2845_PM02G08850 [Panicum miliaceum]